MPLEYVLVGGERSYTTVAFILALGKFTESPFRAMDEYDVFMDAVNRRIATQTLLAFALEESEMQFVLLTPQVGQHKPEQGCGELTERRPASRPKARVATRLWTCCVTASAHTSTCAASAQP